MSNVTNVLNRRQVNGTLLLDAKVCEAQALQPIQDCLFQSEGLGGVRQSATCSYINGTIPEALAGTCVLTSSGENALARCCPTDSVLTHNNQLCQTRRVFATYSTANPGGASAIEECVRLRNATANCQTLTNRLVVVNAASSFRTAGASAAAIPSALVISLVFSLV